MGAALHRVAETDASLLSRVPESSAPALRFKASPRSPLYSALTPTHPLPAVGHAAATKPSPSIHKFCHGLLGLALAVAVFASSSPDPVHGAGGATQIVLLRGALLPTRTRAGELRRVTIKLASLSPEIAGGGKTRTDVIPRLNYANFRFMTKPARVKPAGVKMASLHPLMAAPRRKRAQRFRGAARGFIKWMAYPGCVPKKLKKVLVKLADRFGKLTVNSTHRSAHHNARVGGAKHSFHLKCQAVDFRLGRNSRAAMAFLKKQQVVGGLKHYGGGLFHIDTGPRRTW